MSTYDDRRYDKAVASGEKNRRTLELVLNWCRHARVVKAGGTGLIEMETGLPIGHHHMACDYAPAGGIATWDLADAALDFHDRNCASCTDREPVRLPNLTRLIQERGTFRRRVEDEQRAAKEWQGNQRAARESVRQALRARLDAVSATIVDHLGELDSASPGDAGKRLLGLAKLAPETFTREVQEHLFSLLEAREYWIDEIGLRLLEMLGADPPRLTKCALLSLGQNRSSRLAADIAKTRADLIVPELLPAAIPALVWLAYPENQIGMFEQTRDPAPLIAVFRHHGKIVESAIANLLSQRDPGLVSDGARAIESLSSVDKTLAGRYTRAVAAKLARAHLLIDHRETGIVGEDEVIRHLQGVLALALEAEPDQSDALIADFIESAGSEGEQRLYMAYQIVLGGRGRRNQKPMSQAAAAVALRRLLSAATRSKNDDILREISSTIRYAGDELSSLGRHELSALLGSAVLIDDRLHQLSQEPISDTSVLGHMERQNWLNLFMDLENAMVKWAANAASGHADATNHYVEFLERLPEGQDRARSVLIQNAVPLMSCPEGLNAVLPALYSAMLGASNLVRAAAAQAVGKLTRRGRDDAPSLLYEAFVVLLDDPYVIVHKAAVRALEHVDLHSELDELAKGYVLAWINTYASGSKDDRFLLECIELFLRKYLTDEQKRGRAGRYFVALLKPVKADTVADKISWLRHDLLEADGFPELVVRLLEECERHYRQDDVLRALDALSDAAIHSQCARIERIAIAQDVERDLPLKLVEILTRAGAWEEAARINQVIYDRIPDTVEKRIQKLAANLDRIAARYEATIARGNLDLLPGLAAEWRTTEIQLEEYRQAYARHSSPFPGFPGSD